MLFWLKKAPAGTAPLGPNLQNTQNNMFATYTSMYLQNQNLYLEQTISILAIYNRSIYTMALYLQYIYFVFAKYDRSLYTILLYLQYVYFAFAIHRCLYLQQNNACF